jgi:hypothetical protein
MIIPLMFFEVCLVALMVIGLFIASRLDDSYPRWVRYLCLVPCLAGAFTLHSVILGQYVAYLPDLIILSVYSRTLSISSALKVCLAT